jgi:hypothetical protein
VLSSSLIALLPKGHCALINPYFSAIKALLTGSFPKNGKICLCYFSNTYSKFFKKPVTMLTQDQSHEYNRAKKLNTFFGNTSAISTYTPFREEVNSFNDNLDYLETLIQDKNGTGAGITSTKTTLKQSVANRLAVVCTTTKAFALKYNNATLVAEMNFRANEIFRLKDADFLPFVLHVQELITPLLGDVTYSPYEVTAAVLTAIVADAQTFNSLIGKADVHVTGNTVVNKNIDSVIRLLHNNIVQFDLLIDYFNSTNPDFVAGYHINSAVDNTGVRHTGIEGIITANGQPVSGAQIKLANSTKSAVTDLYGHYSLVRIAPGDYMVEIQAKGFPSKTVVYHINRGRVSTLDLELLAAS